MVTRLKMSVRGHKTQPRSSNSAPREPMHFNWLGSSGCLFCFLSYLSLFFFSFFAPFLSSFLSLFFLYFLIFFLFLCFFLWYASFFFFQNFNLKKKIGRRWKKKMVDLSFDTILTQEEELGFVVESWNKNWGFGE